MNVFLGFAIVVGRTVDDGGWSEYMENMPAFHSDGDVCRVCVWRDLLPKLSRVHINKCGAGKSEHCRKDPVGDAGAA